MAYTYDYNDDDELMVLYTDDQISEMTWSLAILKDYIAKNGDSILRSEINTNVAKQFIFGSYEALKNEFTKNFNKFNSNFYWRLEGKIRGDIAHHFIVFVDSIKKKLVLFNPSEGTSYHKHTTCDISKYSALLAQLCKSIGFRFKIGGPKSPCQPYVHYTEYDDSFCQTWSLILAIAHANKNMNGINFVSNKVSDLDYRMTVLFTEIKKIFGKIVEKNYPKDNYEIFNSIDTTCMIANKMSMSVRRHYTDKKIFQSIMLFVSEPKLKYLTVRDTPLI
jgi:hypothetical protein